MKLSVITFLVIFCIKPSSSIECYKCIGTVGSSCGIYFNPSDTRVVQTKDCNTKRWKRENALPADPSSTTPSMFLNNYLCTKEIYSNHTVIRRCCHVNGTIPYCSMLKDTVGEHLLECNTCSGKLCNGGRFGKIPFSLNVALSVFSTIFKMRT